MLVTRNINTGNENDHKYFQPEVLLCQMKEGLYPMKCYSILTKLLVATHCEGSTADLLLHKTADCLFVEAFDHSIIVGRSISPAHTSSFLEKI